MHLALFFEGMQETGDSGGGQAEALLQFADGLGPVFLEGLQQALEVLFEESVIHAGQGKRCGLGGEDGFLGL